LIKKLKKKTVTLKGDLFDPFGSLTGGSRNFDSTNILKELLELKQKQKEFDDLQNYLENNINNKLNNNQKFLSEIEIKKHEIENLKSRIKDSKISTKFFRM